MDFEWLGEYLELNSPGGDVAMLVCRGDGVVIGRFITDGLIFDEQESAALLCGAWNALKVLQVNNENGQEMRLSYDDSSSGYYVLAIGDFDLFLACHFRNVDNPGKLKNYLKLIREELDAKLAESNYSTKKVTGGKLFEEISDSEMDQLFAF